MQTNCSKNADFRELRTVCESVSTDPGVRVPPVQPAHPICLYPSLGVYPQAMATALDSAGWQVDASGMARSVAQHRCCCPKCGSHQVYRSRRHDHLIYRVVLAACARCYLCQHRFLVMPFWKVTEPVAQEFRGRLAKQRSF